MWWGRWFTLNNRLYYAMRNTYSDQTKIRCRVHPFNPDQFVPNFSNRQFLPFPAAPTLRVWQGKNAFEGLERCNNAKEDERPIRMSTKMAQYQEMRCTKTQNGLRR